MQGTGLGAGYVGRFAPSPTGPLHMGSLAAAVGSYLDARHHGGRWLLRIEDIDPPRAMPGATDAILADLVAHGLRWDGDILFQSTRTAAYEAALQQLRSEHRTFFCRCSRSQVGAGRYPGTCRGRLAPEPDTAERLRCDPGFVHCTDLLQGEIGCDVSEQVGDFVLRRRDGLFAYQLAVVVDDAAQGVTHVVRGADLLDNTPRQVALQHALRLPTPEYLHLPLVLTPAGEKLSKQTHAPPLGGQVQENLQKTLKFLGQPTPAALTGRSCTEMLEIASRSWQRRSIPRMLGLGTD